MSGIVGYVGGQSALEVLLGQLRALERTGPGNDDSVGVALLADGGLAAAKTAGKLADLLALLERRPLPSCGTGVAHIRRATRGAPSETNAHPQLDEAGRVAVVQGGTLDNAEALRAEVTGRGHRLASQTDTEVVAHLLAEAFSSSGELGEAMRQVAGRLRGEFALAALHADEPDAVVAVRRGAGRRLAVGLGQGEAYLVTDRALLDGLPVWEVVEPAEGEVAVVRRAGDEIRCDVVPA
ncbi:glucosamine--fructose-6-phosphate aminotransferase [Streptomyces sp. YIM 98790]|uniref:glucosamine--fructose-6-phosphate aminotransferase n=1 Tax=Streptomyces sp. YIM 98790 TaxID=2689077 RepID=UPI001A9EE7A0|nr:glucosamine--fructose-6-phosphate aminotransferase [Streptomyces sp. YIM 98790]